MAEILNAKQLVEHAREELKGSFGNLEIPVLEPTELLLETQRVAWGEGYGFLRPLYFPSGEIRLDSPSPQGWVKLNSWFFDRMRGTEPSVNPDAAKIGPYWTLFDESNRANFEGDGQFGLILSRGRDEGQIKIPADVSHLERTSRAGVAMDEQDSYVFPEFARPLRLVDPIAQAVAVIRRPKAAEFNFAGNLRLRHLGEHPNWEGFDDKFGANYRLIGGRSSRGGLAYVDYQWTCHPFSRLVFRPLVAFLSQPQSLVTW